MVRLTALTCSWLRQLDQMVRRTPTGRLTEPDEVVPLVRTLLFEHTNVHGQVLTTDGGASI